MKYRVLEKKYENGSIYYPQYRKDNVEKYLLGRGEDGKDEFSDYQFFTEWRDNSSVAHRINFSDINECRKFISEQTNMGEYIKDIIHPL